MRTGFTSLRLAAALMAFGLGVQFLRGRPAGEARVGLEAAEGASAES
ncbi:hypothetical protein ACFLQ0_03785 [Nitrospinota bacterium]